MRIDSANLGRVDALHGVRSDAGILSVYLPIETGLALHHGHIPALMNILRELRESAPEADAERMAEEAERVLAFVRDEYVPHGSCLVLFASRPAGIWETFSLQLPSPAIARFGPQPYLLPLKAFADDYAPALVALVDQHEARLYSLRLGELLERRRITSAVPGRQRQGGWSAFRYEADRAHHVAEHLRRVAEAIVDSDRAEACESLVLAGTKEVTSALAAELPQGLGAKLAGTFAAEMFATDAQIVEAARDVLGTKERERELKTVEAAIQLALDGRQAALGRDETLQMLGEGRARKLILSDRVAFSGDGEVAYRMAQEGRIPVEVVHGEAVRLLEPYAGLAAELRY